MAEAQASTKASHDVILETSKNKLLSDLDAARTRYLTDTIDVKEANFN